MASKRIEYLDAVKGFAIFLVVFAHAIGWNVTDDAKMVDMDYTQPIATAAKGVLWRLVYSFHMPLFFMVSGYFLSMINSDLSHTERRKKLGVLIVNKSQRLLIPYFVTGFIMLAAKGYYGYWFLFGLWEISLLSIFVIYIISYINPKKRIWIDIVTWLIFFVIVKTLLPSLPKNVVVEFDRCVGCVPAFIVGVLLRKYDLLRHLTPRKSLIACLLFVIGFVMGYLPYSHIQALELLERITNAGIWIYVVSVIGSLAVIGIFKCLYEHLNDSRWRVGLCKLFEYLGLFSLEIYIIHIFLVIKLPQIGDWIISQSPAVTITLQFAYALLLSAIAIAGCILVAKLLHRNQHVSWLLFGTKPNSK